MQKKNKALMMAVSTLLCLTLISSCLVSSVFAKYVTQDTATATAVIEKFGVTLSVSSLSATNQTKYGVTVTDNSTPNLKNAGVYSITVSGLKMAPGDTINDLISFTIGGTANVNCRLKIDPIVEFNTANIADENPDDDIKPDTFYIPSGVGASTGRAYFPIQILCNGSINCYSPWKNTPTSDSLDADENMVPGSVSYTVARVLAQNFDLRCDDAKSVKDTSDNDNTPISGGKTDYAFKTFTAGETVTFYKRNSAGYNKAVSSTAVNKLYFGLKYPITYGSGDDQAKYDAMSTYLQEACDPTINITFIVTIEQIA